MKSFRRLLLTGMAASVLAATTSLAVAQTNLSQLENKVRNAFLASFPQSSVEKLETTPLRGIYAVTVDNGQVLYIDESAKYLISGDMFELKPNGFSNLTEKSKEVDRAKILNDIPKSSMIVFSPKGKTKAHINVFTDVDCFYCQKLHKEVPDLNRAGIEVRYLAFPRAGLKSESAKKVISAWCASDKQDAMNKLKARKPIPENLCAVNPVANHYTKGLTIGIKGTPAMLTADGEMMPGYMPAYALAKRLGVELDASLADELRTKANQAARN